MNEAMVEPAPGSTPMRKPTTEPLTKAKRQSFRSCQRRQQVAQALRHRQHRRRALALSMLASTSPIAKTPIATTTKSMPPSSSMLAEGEARGLR